MADDVVAAPPPPPEGFVPVATPNAPPPPPAGFVPVAAAPAPGIFESIGRGAVEGATFGFDDRLGMNRERREASRRANPWAHFAGEVGGGIIPMLAAALLPTGATQAAAAGRAAQLASRGVGLARSALVPGEINTLTQAGLQGAKLGTTYGTLSGVGHAADDESALGAGVRGGLTGAALGAPLGVAGHGVYRGAQGLNNLWNTTRGLTSSSTAVIPAVGGQPPPPVSSGALTTAVRALERDRLAPQDVINTVLSDLPDTTVAAGAGDLARGLQRRFWGPLNNRGEWTSDLVEDVVRRAQNGESASVISAALPANAQGGRPGEAAVRTLIQELTERNRGPLNIVDRASLVRRGAGENTNNSMQAAAATPGEHLGIARENLLERQVGAQSRMTDSMGRLIGSTDFETAAANHQNALQTAAGHAYTDAFAVERPFNLAPVFERWEQQFDRMRGIVPDGVRSRLNSMMWRETNANGQTVRIPPQDLQGVMYAREGLRDLIQELPQGSNLRRHLSRMYDDVTAEAGRDNPLWLRANQIYRDGMAGREAMEAGAAMTTRLNNASRENLQVFTDAQHQHETATSALHRERNRLLGQNGTRARDLTPAERAALTPAQAATLEAAETQVQAANSRMELFRIGLVRALNTMLSNQGETHNVAKQLLLPSAQRMLRTVLGDDVARQFERVVRAEAAMHRTYSSQFGSRTTPLREAIDDQTWAPRFEASMLNPLTWGNPAIRLAQEYAARTINANRNRNLMQLYTETDPLTQLAYLRAMQGLHTSRATWGNTAGLPVVGAAGGVGDAVAGDRAAQTLPPPPPIPIRRP